MPSRRRNLPQSALAQYTEPGRRILGQSQFLRNVTASARNRSPSRQLGFPLVSVGFGSFHLSYSVCSLPPLRLRFLQQDHRTQRVREAKSDGIPDFEFSGTESLALSLQSISAALVRRPGSSAIEALSTARPKLCQLSNAIVSTPRGRNHSRSAKAYFARLHFIQLSVLVVEYTSLDRAIEEIQISNEAESLANQHLL